MGVPQLYRYLCRRVPAMVVLDGDPKGVHEVYVDFNGVLHGAVCELVSGTESVTDASVIRRSIAYLDAILRRFEPSNLVYVAIDGVPPRAKMMQQRWRRLRSRVAAHGWDTNAITPGTPFMGLLSAEVSRWASEGEGSSSSSSSSSTCRRVASLSTEAGEGEQKLFRHMREHHVADATVVICGMDADLLLMAMTELDDARIPYARMYIAREQQQLDPVASVVDVRALAEGVRSLMMHGGLVSDFVALVTLAGNDFLPGLPGLHILRGGIDHLLRVYHEERRAGERLWGGDTGSALLGGLNLQLLQRILFRTARTEGISISRDLLREVRPMETAWRARYYVHVFGCSESEFVTRISRQYVAMAAWSASYMIRKTCLSRGAISENGHAAPLAMDIANAIDDNIDLYCRDLLDRAEREFDDCRRQAGASEEAWHQWQVLPGGRPTDMASAMYPTNPEQERLPPVDLRLLL